MSFKSRICGKNAESSKHRRIMIIHLLTVENLLHICEDDMISYAWTPMTHFFELI